MTEQADPNPHRCLNCDAVLRGQYCGDCGQRARGRLISLWELLREGFGDLLDLDSRLWRTLIPLAIRPGELTRDYLVGRRARYMPPFRMYLVLSLAFFLIAFFDPYEKLGIFFEAPPGAQPEQTAAGSQADDDAAGVQVSIDSELDCTLDDYDASGWPAWLAQRFTKERVQAACLNIVADGGDGLQSVFNRMIENVPTGLFILLPLMGFVLLLLHPLSKRYYVEHLLFVLHYHSFVFLLLTTELLFLHASAFLGLPGAIDQITEFAASVYIPVYLYKSLRRVYGQSHWLTTLKFVTLSACYAVGLALIVGISALIAAFSV